MRKVDEAAAAQAQVGRRYGDRARLARPSEGARRRRWRVTTLTCLLSVAACSGGDRRGDEGDATPQEPPAEKVKYRHVVVGNTQACALREDNTVVCWGATEDEIEQGTLDYYYHDGASPTGVYSSIFLSGAPRSGHPTNSASGRVCAIEDGATSICCWGRMNYGMDGRADCVPMLTSDVADPFISVVNGETRVCGLTNLRVLRCYDDAAHTYSMSSVKEIAGDGSLLDLLTEDNLFQSAIVRNTACNDPPIFVEAPGPLPVTMNEPSLVEGISRCFWSSSSGLIRCEEHWNNWWAGEGVVDVVGRNQTTCAIYNDGRVRCETPDKAEVDPEGIIDNWPTDPPGQFKQIALWPDSASVGCGITLDDELSCWGSPSGQARGIIERAP